MTGMQRTKPVNPFDNKIQTLSLAKGGLHRLGHNSYWIGKHRAVPAPRQIDWMLREGYEPKHYAKHYSEEEVD